MKFLCVPCDEPMQLVESGAPDEMDHPRGPDSIRVVFRCPRCEHTTAMLTNASETQLVRSLGVQLGASTAPAAPLEHLRTSLTHARADALVAAEDEPVWTPEAMQRLNAAPHFVQLMIRQTYSDYARQHGLREITPEVMDAARRVLRMG